VPFLIPLNPERLYDCLATPGKTLGRGASFLKLCENTVRHLSKRAGRQRFLDHSGSSYERRQNAARLPVRQDALRAAESAGKSPPPTQIR
jgi:hypothetical protein